MTEPEHTTVICDRCGYEFDIDDAIHEASTEHGYMVICDECRDRDRMVHFPKERDETIVRPLATFDAKFISNRRVTIPISICAALNIHLGDIVQVGFIVSYYAGAGIIYTQVMTRDRIILHNSVVAPSSHVDGRSVTVSILSVLRNTAWDDGVLFDVESAPMQVNRI